MSESPYSVGDTFRYTDDSVWVVEEVLESGQAIGSYWVRFAPNKPFVPGFYRADFPGVSVDHIAKWHAYPGGPGRTWGGKPFEDAWVRVHVEDAVD